MKAVVIHGFGDTNVFEAMDTVKPEPGPMDLLVQIKASSVNPVDYKIRAGRAPFLAPKQPTILHPDAAGVVAAVGSEVHNFNVGDRVMSFGTGLIGKPGALAEFMVVDARMAAKPAMTLSFEEAAALPLVSVTSWYCMVDAVSIDRHSSVLIMGGTGGVGHIALQLAKQRGAFVAAVCGSEDKCQVARDLGADACLNYKTADMDKYAAISPDGKGFDVVFNTPGAPSINQAVAAAKFGGTILDILGDFPSEPGFQMKWLTFKSIFAGHEILFAQNPARIGEILREINLLVSSHTLKPLVDDQRFFFSEVGRAHAYAEHGNPVGKVVLTQDLGP